MTTATTLIWKGAPLPQPGSTIRITWLHRQGKRQRTDVADLIVSTVSMNGPDLTVTGSSQGELDPVEITLQGSCLIDKWHTLHAAPIEQEPVSIPVPEEPADAGLLELAAKQREWKRVRDEITDIDARLKDLKDLESTLNAEVVEKVIDLGLDGPLSLDGLTFSFSPIKFVEYRTDEDGNKYGTDDVVAALDALGMAQGLVKRTYNGNTFKALLREMDETEGASIPEELAALVALGSRTQLGVTMAAARKRAAARTARKAATTS